MADTQKDSQISLPVVVLLIIVAAALGGGLTSRNDTEHRGRKGHFVVTFGWHEISGGVSLNVERNATHITNPPARATGRGGNKLYNFPGYENDKVRATVLPLRGDFRRTESSELNVTIIFYPDGFNPTLPVAKEDLTPGRHGLTAQWN